MKTWYSKDLGDEIDAHTPTMHILEAFPMAFIAAGQPSDMAVFSRYDLGKNLVTVFFSPSAGTLANVFGAAPCSTPEPDEAFGLLAGPADSWDIHFPGAISTRRK